MISTPRLTKAFVRTADTLVDDYDVVDFLHEFTQDAAEVAGADTVGLLLADHQARLQFMAASNDAGRFLELFQLQTTEGPCWDAFHHRRPVVVTDLTAERERWPTFAGAATAAGFRSAHAFPLRVRDQVLGVMGMFGTSPIAFDDDEVRVVQALAHVATISILNARQVRRGEVIVEQLQSVLNSRIILEQAKGAVARRHGVSLDEALVRLRAEAATTGRLLTDVARSVLGPP